MLEEFAFMTYTQGLRESLAEGIEEEEDTWIVAREDYAIDAETVLPESVQTELTRCLKQQDVAGTAQLIAEHLTQLAQQQGTALEWTPEQFQSLREDKKCIATRLGIVRAFAEYAPQHQRPEQVVTSELGFLTACLLKTAAAPDFDALLANASNEKEGLLRVLSLDWDDVPHEFIHQCAALGEAVVPELCQMLGEHTYPTGIRAAEVLAVIAAERSEVVVSAAPYLLEGFKKERPEPMVEFCKSALKSVGEPVLDYAAAVFQGDAPAQTASHPPSRAPGGRPTPLADAAADCWAARAAPAPVCATAGADTPGRGCSH